MMIKKSIMSVSKNIWLLSILFFVFSNSYAQYSVTLKTDKPVYQADTVLSCIGDVVFTANAKLNGIDVNSTTTFYWDFDDGTTTSGVGLTQVVHKYEKGGGYFPRVIAIKGSDKDYCIAPIRVTQKAIFKGTSSNIPDDKGICDGDEAIVTGIVLEQKWLYEFPSLIEETAPFEINSTRTYNSTITHKAFSHDKVLTNINQIEAIKVNIEHSDASDLQIKLVCPNGTQVYLKKYGGNHFTLGNPVLDDTPSSGQGLEYSWTPTPTYGTLSNSTTGTPGSYLTESPLTDLVGCPLNGDWKIEISDNKTANNGFLFSWQLKFHKSLPIPVWTFVNTYDFLNAIWSGTGAQATSNGVATVIPKGYGESKYKFNIIDNFNCLQDTSIGIRVEKVDIIANPVTGNLPLNVNFSTGTTWVKSYDWDLGENGEHASNKNASHTYNEKGRYKIKLICTSEQGCKSFDTTSIIVTVAPSKVNEYNVFSPNGDNANNIIRLVNEDDVTFKHFEGKIYTRWGTLVCEWKNIDEAKKGWDGTLNNNGSTKLSSGIYYCVIYAVGKDDVVHEIRRAIHLYRNE